MRKEDLGAIVIPRFFQPRVKKFWRYFQRWKINNISKPISKTEIINGLNKLGVSNGMLVWVHSSLSSFGNVVGGPETIILALREVVGKKGTIAMPSFPGQGGEKKYLDSNPIFNPHSTPSRTGKVSDVFWRLDGTLRSNHPTHSIAVSGPLASKIVINHEHATSEFGGDTPFGKLFDLNSEIIFLGVGIEKLSLYHVIEDTNPNFPYNVYLQKKYPAKWIDKNGNEITKMVQVHDTNLSKYRIETPKGIKVRKLLIDELRQKNYIKEKKIGNANCLMFSTNSLLEISNNLIKLGKTIYNIPINKQKAFLKTGNNERRL